MRVFLRRFVVGVGVGLVLILMSTLIGCWHLGCGRQVGISVLPVGVVFQYDPLARIESSFLRWGETPYVWNEIAEEESPEFIGFWQTPKLYSTRLGGDRYLFIPWWLLLSSSATATVIVW